jgi:hypothetical protein
MPFNLLLLPLLGGYILLTLCNRTKFETKRYSGERLVFHAAIVGVFLLLGAFVLAQLTARLAPLLHQAWLAIVPFTYAGTSFVAFLIGCVLWWPLNRWYFPLEVEQRRVILEWGDNLEELLEQAIRETKQVSITMTNGKVYAGFPTVNINPAYERRYVKLLPTSSGYRDPSTHQLVFTTDYARVYAEMALNAYSTAKVTSTNPDEPLDLENVGDLQVIIPLAQISSANLFDPQVYDRFNPPAQ